MNKLETKYKRTVRYTRAMASSKRDFTYNRNGYLYGEVLNRDTLAEMLHVILDLPHKPPTNKSKLGHKIVGIIIDYMIRELKAGKRISIPHFGSMRMVRKKIRADRNRELLPHESKYVIKNKVVFTVNRRSMEKALLLDTF